MIFAQKRIRIDSKPRGFHLITEPVVGECPEISKIAIGLFHLFILHTSASLTINENADRDVRGDMETAMNAIVPETLPFVHTMEGPDDMPAHVKSTMCGSSLSIPIRDGHLAFGTWQGIYLGEHRDRGGARNLIATMFGSPR